MMHIMENPGITRDKLVQKYAKYLQPVPLFELIEVIFIELSIIGYLTHQILYVDCCSMVIVLYCI